MPYTANNPASNRRKAGTPNAQKGKRKTGKQRASSKVTNTTAQKAINKTAPQASKGRRITGTQSNIGSGPGNKAKRRSRRDTVPLIPY